MKYPVHTSLHHYSDLLIPLKKLTVEVEIWASEQGPLCIFFSFVIIGTCITLCCETVYIYTCLPTTASGILFSMRTHIYYLVRRDIELQPPSERNECNIYGYRILSKVMSWRFSRGTEWCSYIKTFTTIFNMAHHHTPTLLGFFMFCDNEYENSSVFFGSNVWAINRCNGKSMTTAFFSWATEICAHKYVTSLSTSWGNIGSPRWCVHHDRYSWGKSWVKMRGPFWHFHVFHIL